MALPTPTDWISFSSIILAHGTVPVLPLALLVTAMVESVPQISPHTVQGLCLAVVPPQSSRNTTEGPGRSLKSHLRTASHRGREKKKQRLMHSSEEHDESEMKSRGVRKLLAG